MSVIGDKFVVEAWNYFLEPGNLKVFLDTTMEYESRPVGL